MVYLDLFPVQDKKRHQVGEAEAMQEHRKCAVR